MKTKFEQYQNPCLFRLRKTRESGAGKALVVMAGGLGKTVVAARDVCDFMQNGRRRVLFLCHSKDILKQNCKKFQEILGGDYAYGFFHGRHKDFEDVDILFATFQTLGGVRAWKEVFLPGEFPYIVIDEAHHIKAKTFEAVQKYFRPEFLLGLTATPFREDGKSITDVFGEPIFTLDFVEAWAKGYLTPVDYRLVTAELTGLEKYLDDKNRPVTLEELDKGAFIKMSPTDLVKDIEERVADLENPQMIVFCRSVKHVEEIAGLMPGSVALHSGMPRRAQEANLQAFRDGKARRIVAMDMLNEGIDVPAVDVIVRLRLTGSAVVFEQQLARGLRIHEDKEQVRVLDYASDMEHLEMLFDLEERIRRAEKAMLREARRNGEISDTDAALFPDEDVVNFVVTLAGSAYVDRKVDIMALLQRAKKTADKYIYGCARDDLLESLAVAVRERGYMPSQTEITRCGAAGGLYAVATYLKYLGPDWEDVIAEVQAYMGDEAARFDWSYVGHAKPAFGSDMTLEQKQLAIVQIIRQFAAEHEGRPPTMEEFCAIKNAPSRAAFDGRIFSSYEAAKEAAGITASSIDREPVYTQEYLLDLLADFTRELGHPPRRIDVDQRKGFPKTTTFCNNLADTTWDGVLAALRAHMGAEAKCYVWSKAERRYQKMVEAFLRRAAELGAIPGMKDLGPKYGTPSETCYKKEFGSFEEFVLSEPVRTALLEMAARGEIRLSPGRGTTLRLGHEPEREDLIQIVRHKAAETGKAPTLASMVHDPFGASATQINYCYGSYLELLNAAQIEYAEWRNTCGHPKSDKRKRNRRGKKA